MVLLLRQVNWSIYIGTGVTSMAMSTYLHAYKMYDTTCIKFQSSKYGLFMQSGFNMTGDNTQGIILQKGSTVIKFDIRIQTPGDVIWCGYFKRGCKVSSVLGDAQHKISVDQAHCLLGHLDENCT